MISPTKITTHTTRRARGLPSTEGGAPCETVTHTLLLTPPRKRKRTSLEKSQMDGKDRTPRPSSVTREKEDRIAGSNESDMTAEHSSAELYSWTFTRAAVAPCFVRDALKLRAAAEYEFFWLGRVPCRVVQLVAMVVGVDVYEGKVRLRVDDGTGAIECDCYLPNLKHPSGKPSASTRITGGPQPSKTQPDEPKIPRFQPGMSIRLKGRLSQGKFTRVLRVEYGDVSVCNGPNEEIRHWRDVMRLHREHYSLDIPFVIPRSQDCCETQATAVTSSDRSPTSSVSALSDLNTGPPKLRHPSKLRTADLTDVAFSSYIKHYLAFPPVYDPISDDALESYERSNTPTPSRAPSPFRTPRAREKAPASDEPARGSVQYGFTLSYLRRVPILADMARGVVLAVEKHRRRKQASSQPTSMLAGSSSAASTPALASKNDEAAIARKMKRLFIKTIRDLYKSGDIFIWSGARRPCWHACVEPSEEDPRAFGRPARSHRYGLPKPANSSADDDDALESESLSEPDENEEAYMPANPSTISPLVLKALQKMTEPESKTAMGRRGAGKPPTAGEITGHLTRVDAQWGNLGEWTVTECLEKLEDDGMVFRAGGGKWALCA